MLQTMRQLAQSWIFKALMLFLCVSFAIWGIGDIFRGNPLRRTVAKAGNITITVQGLDHEFEQQLMRARQMLGPELTPQQAKQLGILDNALNAMIQRAEVDQAIKKLGIEIGDQTVIDWIASQPQLRDKDGKLDKNLLRRVIEQSGLSEQGFIDAARKDMERRQLLSTLQIGDAAPNVVADSLLRARGQKRILDIISLKNNSMTNIPVPDDKTLQNFYQQNAQKYAAPEYRALTIARLSTDDIAKDITISDDDVKKEYDAKPAEWALPERRDVVQVVAENEGKAKQLAAAAKSKGNLSAAAKSEGLNPVSLDKIEEKTTLPDLAKPIFALKENQISDPIKSSLGWHVIQVKKIYPAGTRSFAEVKNELRENMKRDQAIDQATRDVNALDDQLAAGHSLEDIARGLKLHLIKIPALDANGKLPDGKDPAEIPDKDDVLKNAFSQNAGETSPILDDKNGNYVVVRTDEITPSATQPFDKIKDRVLADWKANEQAKRAAAEAENIAKGLREGKPASSYAGQNGVDVRTSKPISVLGDNDPSLPQAVLPQVMKMKKGDVITANGSDQQLVLRLADLVDVDPSADNAGLMKIKDELAGQMPNELGEEYFKYLRIIFPVEIDQNTLDGIRQQGD